jgi:hypothetical protein
MHCPTPKIERNRLYIKKPVGSENDGNCEWQLKGAKSLVNKAFKTCLDNTKAALEERCDDPMVGTNPLNNKKYKPKKPISYENTDGKIIVDINGEYDADMNDEVSKNMKNKYLKYKAKYIALKASIGGGTVYEQKPLKDGQCNIQNDGRHGVTMADTDECLRNQMQFEGGEFTPKGKKIKDKLVLRETQREALKKEAESNVTSSIKNNVFLQNTQKSEPVRQGQKPQVSLYQ